MLLDTSFRPIAYNSEAVEILAFPTRPEVIEQIPVFLADRIRLNLLTVPAAGTTGFVRAYMSGKRQYNCSTYELFCNGQSKNHLWIAVLLEPHSADTAMLNQVSDEFHLTHRECEIVRLLIEGLTSKEIASRLGISPHTVKAFLRLVMAKMDVSTRSGIVGKVVSRQEQ